MARLTTQRIRTATSSTISSVNQTAIVEALRANGPLSRQQIGELTGLSSATVNRLTASLVKEGIATQLGQGVSTGGRPPVLLEYTGSSKVVACLQVQADSTRGALIDFDAHFVYREDVGFEDLPPVGGTVGTDDDERLARTLALLDTLLEVAVGRGTPCAGVGVSVPGVVRMPEGIVERIPEMGWPEVPLLDMVSSRCDVPVVVENDANALAVGESQLGVGVGVSSLVAIHLANGLGAGIISNGQLHRGFSNEAGEIGYLLLGPQSLTRRFELVGDLEGQVGAMALARSALDRGMDVPEQVPLRADEVFARARRGDGVAEELATEFLDKVAMAVGAIAVILDPELIVFDATLAATAETTIPGIRDRLAGRITHVPRIEPAMFGEDGVLMGIAELASHEARGLTWVAR